MDLEGESEMDLILNNKSRAERAQEIVRSLDFNPIKYCTQTLKYESALALSL